MMKKRLRVEHKSPKCEKSEMPTPPLQNGHGKNVIMAVTWSVKDVPLAAQNR